MTPLRIIAALSEPVVYSGDGLHLDGPLAYAAFRELPQADRDALPPLDGPEAADFDLPLDRWECGGAWGWRASAAHADWQHSGSHAVRRYTALGAMTRYTSDEVVNTSSGRLKPESKTYPTHTARTLTWYAVGDRGEVQRLLDMHVPNIGRLSRHGMGRVTEWRVECWPHDWSCERDGALTRRMPHAYRPDEIPGRGSIRAPYHHISRVVACVEPVGGFLGLRP